MTEPPRRVVGKRQVRPNLSRTDFGYTERPRVPVQKAAKKLKRADEEDEAGGATAASDRPARADKDSRSLVRSALLIRVSCSSLSRARALSLALLLALAMSLSLSLPLPLSLCLLWIDYLHVRPLLSGVSSLIC